jgi:hypothetical protein
LTQDRVKSEGGRGITMTSRDDERPIACTLGRNDYRERLAWIAQLNRVGLRSHRRDLMTLELHYAAAVRHRVHQLVRQEAECCAFLGSPLTNRLIK